MKNFRSPLVFALLGVAAAWTSTATADTGAPTHYEVQQKFTLEGNSKYDYTVVDSRRHRLYVTRGTRVQVLDTESGQTVGTIDDTPGVHGVALVESLGLGFTSNGGDNTLTVFDLADLAVKGRIAIQGKKPDAIIYEATSRKLYVFNGESNNLNIVDPTTLKVDAVVAVPGAPEFAAADGEGHVIFNLEDPPGIAKLDLASHRLVQQVDLKDCKGPTGIAVDTARHRAFSSCQNRKLVVTDTRTLERVTEVEIGSHPDAVIFDADSATIFVSNGDDATLSVIRQLNADQYHPEPSVGTATGAKTMAMDERTHRIYLPTGKTNPFTVVVVGPKR